METKLKNLRKVVYKIIKNTGRADLDFTLQVSVNSFQPNKVNYCCQIEAPANGLAPMTWVKESYEELESALKATAEGLKPEDIEKAYYEAELKRANEKVKYFEDKLKESKEPKNSEKEA